MQRRLDDTVSGRDTPESFAPSVWDEWNAKSPRAQVDDALTADAALVARLEAVATSGAEELEFRMGPLTVDFDAFVGLRVNEHTLHTWDVEVALAPQVPLPAEAVPFVVDHLELIARYTGRPTGDERVRAGWRRRIRPGASWSSWPPTPPPSRPGATGLPTSRSPAEAWAAGSSTAGSMPSTRPRRSPATRRCSIPSAPFPRPLDFTASDLRPHAVVVVSSRLSISNWSEFARGGDPILSESVPGRPSRPCAHF